MLLKSYEIDLAGFGWHLGRTLGTQKTASALWSAVVTTFRQLGNYKRICFDLRNKKAATTYAGRLTERTFISMGIGTYLNPNIFCWCGKAKKKLRGVMFNKGSLTQLVESQLDFLLGVHYNRPAPGHPFLNGLAGKIQKPAAIVVGFNVNAIAGVE